MKVLSLFDGMSCGQIALSKLGINISKYYAAEIKKHAIQCVKNNFPNTIHIGDVRKVSYKNGVLTTENGQFSVGDIDLVIGGSPCQDLSSLMANRKGLQGDKSSLFWEYHRIVNEVKPKYFFLENVGSMSPQDGITITNAMGVNGVRIDSCIFSAQLRDRIYWTNIPGNSVDIFGESCFVLPQDKGIILNDILESGETTRDKALCLTARYGGRWSHIIEGQKFRAPKIQKQLIHRYNKGFDNIVFENGYVRLLTIKEQERLQTVPEGYTHGLSFVDAANLLGDGWTIDVICFLFQNLNK